MRRFRSEDWLPWASRMMTLSDLAADLEDVTWQDARTFTTACKKHGPPCRARAHQFTRNIYLSCDIERTLTEAEFTGEALEGEHRVVNPEVAQNGESASHAPQGSTPAARANLANQSGGRDEGTEDQDSAIADVRGTADGRLRNRSRGAADADTEGTRRVGISPQSDRPGGSASRRNTERQHNGAAWTIGVEDATAPASGERASGAANVASSHSEENSRVAPAEGGVKRGTLASSTLDTWVASLNKHRNLPQDGLTRDPALTPVEIEEELQWLATQLQDTFRLPTVQNRNAN